MTATPLTNGLFPGSRPGALRSTRDHHSVQFYADDVLLAERVAAFAGSALRNGGAALLIATGPHLGAIRTVLEQTGDLGGTAGRLDCHLADQTLATFMVDGAVDAALFREHVGQRVERAVRSARGKPVRAFGEMVDILWKQGNIEAALRLEGLWNELAEELPFSLLCAYELKGFAATHHQEAFRRVCAVHSLVTPSEEHASHTASAETMRAMAMLEQKAASLEREIERRTSAEQSREELLRAQTVARARAERTAAQLAALQDLTAALSRAVTLPDIAEIIVDKAGRAVEARRTALYLVDDGGTRLNLVAHRGIPAATAVAFQRIELDGALDVPPAAVFRNGRPQWTESRSELLTTYPHLASALPPPEEGYSAACLPIVASGAPIGCLSFAFDQERRFEPEEHDLHSVIAVACGQALDRGRLFEAERRGRLVAESATKAREEILAVVSHDLRNPLGAVLAAAANLVAVGPEDAGSKKVRVNAERIQRNATRMARFIDDLIDFGSIQTGQLQIAPRPCAGADVVAATVETFKPQADDRAIALVTELDAGLPALTCDCDRIVQALSNLLSNALRFTPGGGTVTLAVRAAGSEVVFQVADTGPGIDPDELPHLFERYWRGRLAPYKGTGLGLTIAKGIVDAHRGRLWAESTRGKGSRFSFALPI